ncbi:unnamed protein product [Cochlearia groenlandica]
MAGGIGKCSKIRHIVRLRQILRRWRDKAKISSLKRCVPSDVPAGHVAFYVGSRCRRFVVRASYLNHPVLKNLLVQAEEEFGFVNQGPLVLPCEESVFEESVRFISDSTRSRWFSSSDECHVETRRKVDLWIESRPLLHSVSENAIW